MIDAYGLQEIILTQDEIRFALEVLGMPLHGGQEYWMRNSTKSINVLKPSNQWGKTTVTAIRHIYHAVAKPKLFRFENLSHEDKFAFQYRTLNFGKTYEIAKGVMEAILEIVEGKFLLPDGTFNKSMLAGWAIVKVQDLPKLPLIVWWNNSKTLIRSYDGLGESFKRLRLAYISGDECGDIAEMRLFLNGTLLPRLFFFQGNVDLIGTSQPKGLEYEEIAAEGEEEMRLKGDLSKYFVLSSNNNPKMAMIYTNTFMPAESIQEIENIADPELKKQIIYGQYVDYNKHLYTFDEVNHMFTKDLPYDPETGWSEVPKPDCYYIVSVDMAASEDETSITGLRYNIRFQGKDGQFHPMPHRVVFHKAWKGASIPLSLQYELIRDIFGSFKKISPRRSFFVYDSGSLGGKNAGQAFASLHGFPFPPKGRSYSDVKAEGMGKVKEVLGRGRAFTINEKGQTVDKNPDWGGVRASIHLKELRRQLEVASKDDDKLKNDQYTSFMQAIHFVESRTSKLGGKTKAIAFDMMRSI